MTAPAVSVVIPVHNAGRHLTACLRSISDQNFEDLEIVLVDDGSTDDSLTICEEFCRSDRRAVLLRESRCGVSVARNLGLKHATGKYVYFVDADDEVAQGGIAELHAVAVGRGADLVLGGFTLIRNGVEFQGQSPMHLSQETLLVALVGGQAHAGMWNKLVRRASLQELEFDRHLSYMEDKVFLIELLVSRVLRIEVADAIVYRYRQHEAAISASTGAELFSMIPAYRRMSQILTAAGTSPVLGAAFDRSVQQSIWRLIRRAGSGIHSADLASAARELAATAADPSGWKLRPLVPSGVARLVARLPRLPSSVLIWFIRRLPATS